MFRQSFILTATDSPFRYAKGVRVSPHIRRKSFGDDVLLFASPSRLTKQADEVLSQISSNGLSPAFWEIFAKRTNESFHLLGFRDVAKILNAFLLKSHRPDLVSGICHLVIQKLDKTPPIESEFRSLDDLLMIARCITLHDAKVPDVAYANLVAAFADACRDLSRDDVLKIAEVVELLRRERLGLTSIEQLLGKRMLRSLGLNTEPCGTFETVFNELKINRN